MQQHEENPPEKNSFLFSITNQKYRIPRPTRWHPLKIVLASADQRSLQLPEEPLSDLEDLLAKYHVSSSAVFG
jgi:hypothetical protein